MIKDPGIDIVWLGARSIISLIDTLRTCPVEDSDGDRFEILADRIERAARGGVYRDLAPPYGSGEILAVSGGWMIEECLKWPPSYIRAIRCDAPWSSGEVRPLKTVTSEALAGRLASAEYRAAAVTAVLDALESGQAGDLHRPEAAPEDGADAGG